MIAKLDLHAALFNGHGLGAAFWDGYGHPPLEPKWVHGKRAVSEPARMLDALEQRVYIYYGCDREPHLTMPEKVA